MTDPTALVVGVGNDLRRDDAAGRVVAERIEASALDGVRVVSVAQLVPEIVESMGDVDVVVFVDADVEVAQVVVEPVAGPVAGAGGVSASALAHHGDPAAILALHAALRGPPPVALVVRIPATDLGVGTGLTPACAAHVERAVAAVTGLVS